MEKARVKFWVDVCMGISFLIVLVTGIFKWPGLAQTTFSGVYDFVSFRVISRVHDWSGLLMAGLVFVHLCLNWAWIKAMSQQIFR